MANSKGTKVHQYPDMFLEDEKITVIVVCYDNSQYYAFAFRKNIVTDDQPVKETIAKKKSSLEACKMACSSYIDKKVSLDGWKVPFAKIAEQAEEKKIINFLDKYG